MGPPPSQEPERLERKRAGRPAREGGAEVRERLLNAATELTIERGFDAALKEPDGTPSTSMQKVHATQAEGESLREAIDEWLYRTFVANLPQGFSGGLTDISVRVR